MKYFKAIATSDFKNSSKIKLFNAKFFVAKYNPTKQNPETNFKFIIDREDDRRLVLTLSENEIDELLEQLKSLKNN